MIGDLQALWLGILQGLTEFLPVSSSGHLVLGQNILGVNQPDLLFDVAVHVGTLVAVLFCFREDIVSILRGLWAKDDQAREGRRLLFLIVVGSVPTALIGLLFKDQFEALFSSLSAVGVALLVTGGLLMATRFAPQGRRGLNATGPGRALLVGLFQGLAITPGISRSGATISAGLYLGLDRRLAAHFSFLLSIPAILGALALELKDVEFSTVAVSPLLLGGVAAALSGYFALKVLLKVVQKGRLYWFAPYCWALGLAVLAMGFWRF